MPKSKNRRKKERSGNAKKPRTEYIYATTKGEISEIALSTDPRTGEIRFETEMENVFSEASYERPKGPKILFRIPQKSRDLSFDASVALTKNYDFLCAVDTNTKVFKHKTISIVGVVTFQTVWVPDPEGLRLYWQFDCPFCLEYIGLRANPEIFGWIAAFNLLRQRGLLDGITKLGMVVDSDLANLRDYNERKKPIFEAHMLPKRMQLLYATADSGKENVLNKAISAADSVASQVLSALASGEVPLVVKPSGSDLFESHRIIIPNLLRE